MTSAYGCYNPADSSGGELKTAECNVIACNLKIIRATQKYTSGSSRFYSDIIGAYY